MRFGLPLPLYRSAGIMCQSSLWTIIPADRPRGGIARPYRPPISRDMFRNEWKTFWCSLGALSQLMLSSEQLSLRKRSILVLFSKMNCQMAQNCSPDPKVQDLNPPGDPLKGCRGTYPAISSSDARLLAPKSCNLRDGKFASTWRAVPPEPGEQMSSPQRNKTRERVSPRDSGYPSRNTNPRE